MTHPQTRLYLPLTQYLQNEIEARFLLDFLQKAHSQSGKKLTKTKMATQLKTSSSLDRRSTSRNMQVATFNELPSVGSKEKIFIVLQRKRASTCGDIMDGSDLQLKCMV